jgi:hypothetical protein
MVSNFKWIGMPVLYNAVHKITSGVHWSLIEMGIMQFIWIEVSDIEIQQNLCNGMGYTE